MPEKKKDASAPVNQGASHSPLAGLVRMSPLMGVPQILKDMGHDPEPIITSVGLRPEAFTQPELKIPFVAMDRLIARCVAETGCQHFGLLIGMSMSSSSLGLLGFVLQHAASVAAALEDFIRYQYLHDSGSVTSLTVEDGFAFFGHSICMEGLEAEGQIYDGSVAAGQNVVAGLCGQGFRATEVRLSRCKPANRAPYDKFFLAPVRFEADHSGIIFPDHWLDAVPLRSDPLLYRFMKNEAETIIANQPGTFAGKLQPLLRLLLLSQNCSLAEAAKQLGVHSRTLNRRLRDEGTSFHREAESARYLLARQILSEEYHSISEVAATLGYADASAFAHAFKRWSGQSPGQWRMQHNQPV